MPNYYYKSLNGSFRVIRDSILKGRGGENKKLIRALPCAEKDQLGKQFFSSLFCVTYNITLVRSNCFYLCKATKFKKIFMFKCSMLERPPRINKNFCMLVSAGNRD